MSHWTADDIDHLLEVAEMHGEEPLKLKSFVTRCLCADEREIIAEVINGLLRGRDVYGSLDLGTDRRSMDEESRQEMRDWLIYRTARCIQRGRGIP